MTRKVFVIIAAVALASMALVIVMERSRPAHWNAADTRSETIRAMLTTLNENGQFNGSVLVAQNGVVIYRDAFGTGDGSWFKNQPDTPSNLASVSKQFTAMAVMMLAEARQDSLRRSDYELFPFAEGSGPKDHHPTSSNSHVRHPGRRRSGDRPSGPERI